MDALMAQSANAKRRKLEGVWIVPSIHWPLSCCERRYMYLYCVQFMPWSFAYLWELWVYTSAKLGRVSVHCSDLVKTDSGDGSILKDLVLHAAW